MEDLYNILAKHFAGIASKEEEILIEEYRQHNSLEYDLLKKFWEKGDVATFDFNTSDAWKKVERKIQKKPSKVIPQHGYFRKIAAAVILLIGLTIAYYIVDIPGKTTAIVSNNTDNKFHQIELADGSKIWLNKNASLAYPSKFDGALREVTLTGTAFFEITKDSAHPFIISTDNSKITVLGTSFNVNAPINSTEVNVASGVVEVFSKMTNERKIIAKNQTALVSDGQLATFETTNLNFLSWKTGVFQFNNTPIQKVISDLNTFYEDQIVLYKEVHLECALTAQFNNSNIGSIMEILQTTCDITITKDNNIYIIQ